MVLAVLAEKQRVGEHCGRPGAGAARDVGQRDDEDEDEEEE